MHTKIDLASVTAADETIDNKGTIRDQLADLLTLGMDGADYGQGALEDIQGSLDKQGKIIARLFSLLRKKGMLTNEEIVQLFKYLF